MRRKRSGEVALASEIGVAEDGQVAEVRAAADTADVRKPLPQVRLPYPLLGGLRCEQHDTPALVKDESLDQHQADEGLAKTHAVTEERTAVLPGDLHERPVRLLLIAVEVRGTCATVFHPIQWQLAHGRGRTAAGPSHRRRMVNTGVYGARSYRLRHR